MSSNTPFINDSVTNLQNVCLKAGSSRFQPSLTNELNLVTPYAIIYSVTFFSKF